jgi:hypothetical protein
MEMIAIKVSEATDDQLEKHYLDYNIDNKGRNQIAIEFDEQRPNYYITYNLGYKPYGDRKAIMVDYQSYLLRNGIKFIGINT